MPIKILIIEDQYNNMRLIEQIVGDIDERIYITKAETGALALALAKDEEYDLVLSDISLPDMDGIQIATELKTYKQLKKTPFIAITAYTSLSDENTIRQYFEDYLPKPIDDDLLVEKIVKWIGDKLSG